MRLKLGRPDLARYAHLFNLPDAPVGELGITWLGVSSLLIDDGTSAFLTDGFFSRPSLIRVGAGRVAPDHSRISAALGRAGISDLEAVIPVHSHYDHVMDAPEVARRTGARFIGGASSAQVAMGADLPTHQIETVNNGTTIPLSNGTITFIEAEHCPPDRYPGTITAPVTPPVRVTAYRCGETWSLIHRHDSGTSTLIQGSAGHRVGALAGQQAEVAYLGIGQLGVQPDDYVREYWDETVRTVGARQVVLTHWDDFFRPLDRPIRALPYAGDDLDRTMTALVEFAREDDVALHFPRLWQRESPWRLT